MRDEDLDLLVSPTGGRLELHDAERQAAEIVSGELAAADGSTFPIRAGIPRFVRDDGYARSFALQWTWYRRVQLEGTRGPELTRQRFFEGTGWTAGELAGSLVLEVGCGAGRFTQVLLECGARVCSFDYSAAVDACRETVGRRPGLILAQADLYAAPFPEGRFDKVFCFGVLQHTPEPRAAFLRLASHVRPGGEIAIDVYAKTSRTDRWSAKYRVRPLTTRLPPERLRRLVEWYMPRWLPIDTRLARVPRLGRFLVSVVPCWNYTGSLDDPDEIRNWAVLDTFDALSARYDKPQTIEAVNEWFRSAQLEKVCVRYGGNGIVARGRRPD